MEEVVALIDGVLVEDERVPPVAPDTFVFFNTIPYRFQKWTKSSTRSGER